MLRMVPPPPEGEGAPTAANLRRGSSAPEGDWLSKRVFVKRPDRPGDTGKGNLGPVGRTRTGSRDEELVTHQGREHIAVAVEVLEADHLLVLKRNPMVG